MTAEELKTYVRTMLNAAFPTVTIQFERISDDPFHIGVAVYGVESNAVKWVKGKILDIDEKLCSDTEFVITPLVRDEATTEKFYPEFISPWKAFHSSVYVSLSCQVQVRTEAGDLEGVLRESAEKWEHSESVSASAANQELALAA
jgi:hypothetical protein